MFTFLGKKNSNLTVLHAVCRTVVGTTPMGHTGRQSTKEERGTIQELYAFERSRSVNYPWQSIYVTLNKLVTQAYFPRSSVILKVHSPNDNWTKNNWLYKRKKGPRGSLAWSMTRWKWDNRLKSDWNMILSNRIRINEMAAEGPERG